MQGILGRDIAAIMNIDKDKSINELIESKIKCINNEESVQLSEKEYWEDRIKEICIDEFVLRTNKNIIRQRKIITDEEYDFMISAIDSIIIGENSILICENDNNIVSRVWNYSELQAKYILMCQHNMRVTKAEKCYVVSLVNCERLIIKEIERDERIIQMLIKIEKDFWENNILKRMGKNNG